jgi:hypothetical protein
MDVHPIPGGRRVRLTPGYLVRRRWRQNSARKFCTRFFDLEQQLDKINQINGFLPKLNSLINWEMFRPTLNKVREKEHLGPGGRTPFDVVLMFKILILKKIYNLSDDQTELQIRDRISFRTFLGLNFCDTVPDVRP